jgi:hypothetical protein
MELFVINLMWNKSEFQGLMWKIMNKCAESFLGCDQLLSYSRISQHFMEPQISLPCSQEPSTGAYRETDGSSPYALMLLPQGPFYAKSHVHIPLLRSFQGIRPSSRACVTKLFLRWIVSPTLNHEARGSHLVGCQRLLIKYIHSYPPYLLHPQPEHAPCRGDKRST